jgi:peptidoglycan-N-acetylglucosamine deacetylase
MITASVRLREALDRLAERLPLVGEGTRFVFAAPPGERRAIALTFDDGPSPHNTPRLLDLLASCGARATFFVVGDQIAGNEEILMRLVSEGHEVGNHTYSHPHTIRLRRDALRDELERTNIAIQRFARPRLVRPPFGKDRRRVATVGAELGLQAVLWSIDSLDTSLGEGTRVAEGVRTRAASGAIVLMHDGGGPRPATLEAVEIVLPDLISRGFDLVTVSELLQPIRSGDGQAAPSVSSKGP